MHLHCWKECRRICKLTKCKGDTLKASKDLAVQSRREILLTFVWWRGLIFSPLLTNVTLRSYIIVKSRSNLASLLTVGDSFSRVDRFSPVKS